MTILTKRIVAFCLVFFLVCSTVPLGAFATGSDEETDTKLEIFNPSAGDDERVLPESDPLDVALNPAIPSDVSTHSGDSESDVTRYTVLLLDVEQEFALSYNGVPIYEVATPLETIKMAAKKFVDQVQSANGTNYVAIVSYASTASIEATFDADSYLLTYAIDNLEKGDFGANINAAYLLADTLLSNVTDENAIKNVVLFTQGVCTAGEHSSTGKYSFDDCTWSRTDTGVYVYEYSNAAYATAAELMEKYYLYSIGLFQNFDSVPEKGQTLLSFARIFSEDLQNAGYQEVDDIDDLEFAFGEVAGDVTSNNIKKTGTFFYASGSDTDYTATFYYDDDYFTTSAFEYQDSLATMSMCLAFSAFGSNRVPNDAEGYQKKSQNLEYLLKQCGFDHFDTNSGYRNKPEQDSIGVGAAYKTITDGDETYTLIAAAIRGGGYESEWSSNFTLGTSGTHQGFTEARDQVIAFLKEYVSDHDITGNVKLWITGYSRAAATTNMVAGKLDSNNTILGNGIELSNENIYAYCFECPQGALMTDGVNNPEIYGNIHNIINPSDVVTKVAPTYPTTFGFSRYGENHYLPTALKSGTGYMGSTYHGGSYAELRDAMLQKYNALPSTEEYIVDNFQMKQISFKNLIWDIKGYLEEGIVVDDNDQKWDQNAFLDEMLYCLFNEIVQNRDNYVAVYEDDIREICYVVFGSEGKWDDFTDEFIAYLTDHIVEIAVYLKYNKTSQLGTVIEDAAVNAMNAANITSYSSAEIKDFAGKIVKLLLSFGISHPNLTVTAIENIEGIGAAHFPELCLAWMQSFDPNYTPEGHAAFTSGIHRVLRINCPVDVFVYDVNHNLIAAITNDRSQDIEGSTIVTYVNEHGEKMVYLPANETYQIELTATADGEMDYSIQEYSEAIGSVNRIVNFYDLGLSDGLTYTSSIPTLTSQELEADSVAGSATVYSLYDPDGNVVTPNVDISGESAISANYEVNVSVNNTEYGTTTGTGIYRLGQYVKLTATPVTGCRFIGWYVDGELISEELEYRFSVTEDIQADAYFQPIFGDVDGDGNVDIFDANLIVACYNGTADLNAIQQAAADVNGDGTVDIFDANLVVSYYNGTIISFPCEE